MILVGELSLWVALLMATWAATVSFAGGSLGRRDLIASGERGIYATIAMLALASLGLWAAIFTHDFSLKYVASLTSANLPTTYLFASFWAGRAGSLLFCSLVLSIYSAIAVFSNRTRNRAFMPYVSGALALVLAFMIAVMCFGANPYERLDFIPPEGRGMNPLLQNPGVMVHPPSLYFGYAATAIPFAFAIAALLIRKLDDEWLVAATRWAVLAWFFNIVGILAGMWWAHVEPGRGGKWAWNSVENASLLPWLVSTAFLYSVVVEQKRGMLRKRNVTVVVSTFLLATLGTLVISNGIISSAQSFAQSPFGRWFAVFLLFCIVTTAYLVTTRLEDVEVKADVENAMRRGSYVVYMSIGVIAFGLAGLAFEKEQDLTFRPGDKRELVDPLNRRWSFVSQGISTYGVLNRQVTAVVLDVSRDGQPAGVITSEIRQHVDSREMPTFEPSIEVGIRRSLREDVTIVLAGVGGDDTAEIRVVFTPFVNLVWLGGALLAIGGLIVMWPRVRPAELEAIEAALKEDK